jgi:hypothetical protein
VGKFSTFYQIIYQISDIANELDGKSVILGPCSLANHIELHIWTRIHIVFTLISGTSSRGDGRHAILQLVENHPQQMTTKIW